jgi:DNA repair protein RecO (recombination protein O)
LTTTRVFHDEAVVLRRSDLGEADRVVTLYTLEHGKLRAVAKGVRRTTSRLGGHLELFTRAKVLVAKGRDLDIVTQAETIDAYVGLRDDLWRAAYACYVAELLDRLLQDHSPDPGSYGLLLATLGRVASDRSPELAVRFFEMHLLGLLGYRPQLYRCVRCDELLGPTANFFSAAAGGVLCLACGQADASARGITTNAFKVLRLIQSGDYATTSRLHVSEPLRRELEQILKGYSEFILEREVRSAALLDSLRALPVAT